MPTRPYAPMVTSSKAHGPRSGRSHAAQRVSAPTWLSRARNCGSDIGQGLLGADPVPDIARLQRGLGRTLLDRGRVGEARDVLERSWTKWQEDVRVPRSVRARLAFDFARTLAKASDRARRQLSHNARALLLDLLGGRDDLAQIDAWLRRHG